MNNIKKTIPNVSLIGVSVLFFLFLEILIFSTIKYLENIDKKNFLDIKAKEFSVQVEVGKHYLSEIARLFYDKVIDDPQTIEIMYEASHTNDLKEQAVLRARLYEKFQSDYLYMKKMGVRQLHFHLPNAVSFLRFHRIEKFGDSLANVRESIIHVNKYKKPIECFEEGRIFNGFRHVYPIFKDEELIGTVEISYSFDAFLEHLIDINNEAAYLFLVNNDVIRKKVFEDEQNNYLQSAFEGYSIDKNTLHGNMGVDLQKLLSLNKTIASEVKDDLKNKDNFTVSAVTNDEINQNMIVSFIAVKNFEKKKAAYIVGYTKSLAIDTIYRRTSQVFVLLSLANMLLSFFLFLLLKMEKCRNSFQSDTKQPD